MQLIAEKEISTVVASLVVHCCAIKRNVIVASQLHHVAMYSSQYSRGRRPLELLQFVQKYINLGTLFHIQ